MSPLDKNLVEAEIIKTILEIKSSLKIEATIDNDSCPGSIGISSQILITVMGRISNTLGVIIPDDCYIFHDKKTKKQLSIKEAAQKLVKVAKYGN